MKQHSSLVVLASLFVFSAQETKPVSKVTVETLSKDLSAGGLQCLSPTLFPVASEINIEVMLSTGDEPLIVRGRTSWFRMIPHSEQFEMGIAFDGLPPMTKRRLSAYLDRLAYQTASSGVA